MDLSTLADDDLDEMRKRILAEQERRTNLASIPAQIEELRDKYVSGGGDPGDLA